MRAASVRLATWLTLGFCSLAAGPALAQQVCKYESIVATAPASRFTDNGNGTATDTATGLQWKRCSEGQTWNGTTCTGTATTHTWRQALNRANTASYAGKSDWRLPNVKELASIVEQACHNLAIDLAVFPASPGPWYWSSSPNAYYADFAWCVDFRSGSDGINYKSDDNHVRLVRAGRALLSSDNADFNLDGKTDVLWRNTVSGANRIWMMNGTDRTSVVKLPALTDISWHVVGTGDFNADGKVDILWRNKVTGANRVWRMNGTKRASVAALPADASLNWEIVGG